jgi:ferredoxin
MTVLERDGFRFGIAKPILEADLIVNLPKIKSHSLTLLTAAVKNFYGAIPGFQKTQLHKEYPQRQMFGRLIRTVAQCMPQSLNLADGIIGMEGDGPSNGRPVRLGFVAASSDPFALDIALCKALYIRPEKVPFLVDLHNKPPYDEIVWRGYKPDIPDFRLPRNGHFYLNILPAGVIKNLAKGLWIRPAFNEKCIRCSRCVKACPVKALSMPANGHPLLNGALCIGCCCCHEVCPAGAIRMAPSLALKILNKIRKVMRRA